jgi:hypothetical protein
MLRNIPQTASSRFSWPHRPAVSSQRMVGRGHRHVGEVERSLELAQRIFNPHFVLAEVENLMLRGDPPYNWGPEELADGEVDPLEVWRHYRNKWSLVGVPLNPMFLRLDGCFLCAWCSGSNKFAPFFDDIHYRLRNDDVVAEDAEPLSHWLIHGSREGRSPSAFLRVRDGFGAQDTAGDFDRFLFSNCSAFLRGAFVTGSEKRHDQLLHSLYGLTFCGCVHEDHEAASSWCKKLLASFDGEQQ